MGVSHSLDHELFSSPTLKKDLEVESAHFINDEEYNTGQIIPEQPGQHFVL